ncbi:hypothetical protein BH09SUM1_BH09SUM1_18310 [soil metagenome]
MELNDDARLSVKQALQFLALAVLALAIFHGPVLSGAQVFCGGDIVNQTFPMRDAQARLGWFAGWAPETFSGFPIMDNIQSGAFYPLNWLNWLHWLGLPIIRVMSMLTLLHAVIGAMGLFVFTRQRTGFWGASLAGLLYGFSGFQLQRISNGVFPFSESFAWIPWCWLAAEKQRLDKSPAAAWTGLLAIFAALMLSVGAPQIVQITWTGIAIWTLGRVIAEPGQRKAIILGFCAAGLLSILACAPTLISAMRLQTEAAPRSVAGDLDFLTHDSMSGHIMAAWIFPEIYAPGNDEDIYWEKDGNFAETNVYAGIAPLILALFAVVCGVRALVRKSSRGERWQWTAAALALFGLLMSLGGGGLIFPLLAKFIPTFSLFRAPCRWIVWTLLPTFVAAGCGLEMLIARRQKLTAIWLSVSGVVCAAFLLCTIFNARLAGALGLYEIARTRGADRSVLEAMQTHAASSTMASLAFAVGTLAAGMIALLPSRMRRFAAAAFLLIAAADLRHYWNPFTMAIPVELAHRDLSSEAPYHCIQASAYRDYFYPETNLVTALRKEMGRVSYTDVFISYFYDQEARELSTERPIVLGVPVTRGYQQIHLSSYATDYYTSFNAPGDGVPGGFMKTDLMRDRRFLDAYNVTTVLSQRYPAFDENLKAVGLGEPRSIDERDMIAFANAHARGWAWLSDSEEFIDAVPNSADGEATVDKRDASLWSGSVMAKKECYLHLSSPDYSGWQFVVRDEAGEQIDPENSRTVRLPAAGKYTFERSFYRIGLKPSNVFLALLAVAIAGGMVVVGARRRFLEG